MCFNMDMCEIFDDCVCMFVCVQMPTCQLADLVDGVFKY